METKELEQKVLGFMRNSEDKYAKHLITELLDTLRERDKEIERWKREKVQVVYKERPNNDFETQFSNLFGYGNNNFGPGGA